jgi:hypothetical protein
MHITTSKETQLDEYATKLEKDFSLVSFLSTNKTTRSVWFLVSCSYIHIPKAWELFISLT